MFAQKILGHRGLRDSGAAGGDMSRPVPRVSGAAPRSIERGRARHFCRALPSLHAWYEFPLFLPPRALASVGCACVPLLPASLGIGTFLSPRLAVPASPPRWASSSVSSRLPNCPGCSNQPSVLLISDDRRAVRAPPLTASRPLQTRHVRGCTRRSNRVLFARDQGCTSRMPWRTRAR